MIFHELQALVDLHFFTLANPDSDVDAMLSTTSPTFKNFIMRGLHKVQYGTQPYNMPACGGQVGTCRPQPVCMQHSLKV